MALRLTWVLLILGLTAFVDVKAALRCLDDSGASVDWFIALKHPQDSSNSDPLIVNGLGYVYLTSSSSSTGWKFSSLGVDDPNSFVGRTMKQVYDQHTDSGISYIFYNDEKPDGSTSSAKGHTKGVTAFTSTEGFWLIHSVPKYPPQASDGYSFPSNGDDNGQSFLCISMDSSQAEIVGGQLKYNEPYIYDSKIASWTNTDAPSFVGAANGDVTTGSRKIALTTKAGFTMQSFAKYRDFNADLYHDFVATSLGIDLWASTWQNGAGALPSDCSGTYTAENVDEVTIAAFGTSWPNTKDHSKWCVSKSSSKPWACVGDINRVEAQEGRGGGTVCLNLSKAYTAFHDIVSAYESC